MHIKDQQFSKQMARDRFVRFWTMDAVTTVLCAGIFLIFAAIHRAHGEELWIAVTKANCAGLTVVLFAGIEQEGEETPASFWRMYFDHDNPPRGLKTFKEIDGEVYFRGKKCKVAD